jgi:hypothetical protein
MQHLIMNLQSFYIKNDSEILNSVIEFNDKSHLWKAAIGNAPKYFVHFEKSNKHHFGLSKFCVLKNVSVEEYISTFRYKTDGNNSRLIIQHRLEKNWIPRAKTDKSIREAFDKWIHSFFPNYTLENANFISIPYVVKRVKKNRLVTPEQLKQALEFQSSIGEIGEEIAFRYEVKRLQDLGLKNVKKYITHTSKENVSAGFDIASIVNNDQTRFIEVKSTLTKPNDFYISENELITLEQLGSTAYLYCVKISDMENRKGSVYRIIQNPIKHLKENSSLKPVLYKASL